jgi:hypothetical protein
LILPLIILMFFMGVYPRVFLDRSRASVAAVRDRVATPQAGGSIKAALDRKDSDR